MRYYCPFPDTIPLRRAGCSRVTHPSATQSYQISFRRNHSSSFVRLACVRHAASVRPEPGSNSLKYCINTSLDVLTYFRVYRLIFDADASSIPLTSSVTELLLKSTSFLKFLSGSFSSRCLIFKVQFRRLFQDSSLSISHFPSLVNTLF